MSGSITSPLIEVDEVSDSIKDLLKTLYPFDETNQQIGSYLKQVEKPFIQDYFSNSIGETHKFADFKVTDVFKINRPEEQIEFRKDLHNHRLLWHGTQSHKICSILQDGFDLNFAKPTAMFGEGVYFSDCSTKSLNYCNAHYSFDPIETSYYLLLCEVALGTVKKYRSANPSAVETLKDEEHSVLGEGKWSPAMENYDEEAALMICGGKLVKQNESAILNYNEYVIYSTNQIKMRYLVKITRVGPLVEESPDSFLKNLALCLFLFFAAIVELFILSIPSLVLYYLFGVKKWYFHVLFYICIMGFIVFAAILAELYESYFAPKIEKKPVKKTTRPVKSDQLTVNQNSSLLIDV